MFLRQLLPELGQLYLVAGQTNVQMYYFDKAVGVMNDDDVLLKSKGLY